MTTEDNGPESGPDTAQAGGSAAGGSAAGDGAAGEGAVSRFVERFAAQLADAGMQRMPARVFAALLASESGALTSAGLCAQLKVSPAAISGAVRYLTQVNMVTREREPGSRRDRFRVHSNQWYEALTSRDMVIKRWEDALRDGVTSLGPDSPQGRRLGETLAFFEFLHGELATLMERWDVEREKRFG